MTYCIEKTPHIFTVAELTGTLSQISIASILATLSNALLHIRYETWANQPLAGKSLSHWQLNLRDKFEVVRELRSRPTSSMLLMSTSSPSDVNHDVAFTSQLVLTIRRHHTTILYHPAPL